MDDGILGEANEFDLDIRTSTAAEGAKPQMGGASNTYDDWCTFGYSCYTICQGSCEGCSYTDYTLCPAVC